ncbi:DUF881 domain-containing protein [Phytomonospora sp. NPDC050363]|uniref:DUF881 domain-containing protein n=1 Tax=Phytomonospora sp. NPDC050363 TaxID=3155642 RepID=UPI0033D2FB84
MSEYTGGSRRRGRRLGWAATLRLAARRVRRALRPHRGERRRRGWGMAVPAVMLSAGLLFSATATAARGTDLRVDDSVQLRELIAQRAEEIAREDEVARDLRGQNEALTDGLAGGDDEIAAERDRAEAELGPAGMTAVHGPALIIGLDDAPRRGDGVLPPGATVDDVVVHQQDVQAVVNALWAGGAEAMTIMDVRVISTSAVRCVGNTLLLHGQVYSPPFVIAAIGPADRMLQALDASPGVAAYRQAAEDFGLGYDVRQEPDRVMPAYDGSHELTNAEPVR